MRNGILVVGLSVLLVTLNAACALNTNSELTTPPSSTEHLEKKPAQFEIGTLIIKPDPAIIDYPANIYTTVNNNGDIAGTYEASLLVDGQKIDKKDITLTPGATSEISFQVTKTTAGSYKITVGDSKATLTVCTWTPQIIQYDSGVYDPQMMGTCIWGKGVGHIVHFTPLAPPFEIQKISISAFFNLENLADSNKRMFTVKIWNEDKTTQLWSGDFPWSLFTGGGWKEIKVPDIVADGDFHVEVITNSDAPPSQNRLAVNYEESKAETRSGISYMGSIRTVEDYAVRDKRWFIRVAGEGPSSECISQNVRSRAEEESTSKTEMTIPSYKLVYEYHFNSPGIGVGWGIKSTKEARYYYDDGEYHILINKSNWVEWVYDENLASLADCILEADARLVDGPMDSCYGLIFRLQNNDNFYVFKVRGNGYYFIGKRTDGKWTVLSDWTRSDLIKEDYSENHIKLICKGSEIQAYVNGHYLATVTDNAFVTGYFGLIVQACEPYAHVAFDNLKVYIPAD